MGYIITELHVLLKQQLTEVEQKEWLWTYLLHTSIQDLRIVLGIIFKSLVQFQLQNAITLNLDPMVREPGQEGNTKRESQSSLDTSCQIQFEPKDMVMYNGPQPSGIEKGVFYIPMSQNQVASFDSFLLVGQVLCMFQMTITTFHKIEEGIIESLSQPMLDAQGG